MGWAYRTFVRPVQRLQSSEGAHGRALRMLRLASGTRAGQAALRRLYKPKQAESVEVWGLHFPNCFGLAAGMDKRAEALRGWSSIGFGFIEVGGVTMHAQEGNPKPRMFRDDRSRSLINRMGFNNDGSEAVAERISKDLSKRGSLPCPLFVNLGKSKITPNEDALSDYATSMQRLHHVVDGFVVNVSSPNTPNLRDLQHESMLGDLLEGLSKVLSDLNDTVESPRPMLVKFAPDLDVPTLLAMVDVARNAGADGVVLTNTTVERGPAEHPDHARFLAEKGGLSGAPLKDRSTALIQAVHDHTSGSWPIIGVGGISNAKDAQEKLDAGATLLQAYSAFVFEGPSLVRNVVDGLASTSAS
ncbi:MAG TPA: quinone-dependent dihydroorotate dehydrogenase [Candidatus Poseidoniales archaeon]|nr:MAG TPA: quinone-dependent dihydroorotate dehydrogenase [Candidatus Poseidoniales archaeon]|tara:strand:- start:398 stop:1471 length:1074 start_codon:yes stop_codon:yes gene_type:complete